MSLKIIGAGYGRTGTLSTYTALNMLGFRCYHMVELLMKQSNRHHVDFWLNVSRSEPGHPHDWPFVYKEYSATLDNPGACVWRDLMAAYPEARVILTVHPRGADAWYESTLDTIYFSEKRWEFKVLGFISPFARKMGEITHRLVWQRNHRNTMGNRSAAVADYHRHIEDVTASVPPEKLLVFSVDQGWEPLCAFLGVGIPAAEFPNVNDRKTIKRMNMAMMAASYIIMAAGAAAFLALVAACTRFLGH
jgi:hypothetical protein